MKSGVVWSPCSKFIAVGTRKSVEVLDAATLNRLATFKCSFPSSLFHLGFSPDSRSLTLLHTDGEVIIWDLQTGGRLSEIRGGLLSQYFVQSFTHSTDGKVVAAAYKHIYGIEYKVYTFDLPSRTRLGPLIVSDGIVSDGKLVTPIWTHDKYLRFATIHPGSITIWEVEFTLKHPPTQVESFPVPDRVFDGREFLFLPVFYRLAFTLEDIIEVRDVKASKLLFVSQDTQGFSSPSTYSFSSDGHFFAFLTGANEVHVWKGSPVGYVLHQQSPPLPDDVRWMHLSPNGGSIVFPLDDTVNLWHARDKIPPPPPSPTEKRSQENFILTFSLNQKSAGFARRGKNVVTIIDLKSGSSRLTIDTGMEVLCLGVAEDTVIVVDGEKIVTWNLPGGDRAFNAGINDSVRSVMLDRSQLSRRVTHTLSPHLSFFAVSGSSESVLFLEIYDVHTGTRLASATPRRLYLPWFTQDEREFWVFDGSEYEGWEIIKDDESGGMELKPLEETSCPSGMPPWQSHHCYEVTDDGWVLSPTRERLLWLPHRWRSDWEKCRLWSGRFLGLSNRLSEVVILEFFE